MSTLLHAIILGVVGGFLVNSILYRNLLTLTAGFFLLIWALRTEVARELWFSVAIVMSIIFFLLDVLVMLDKLHREARKKATAQGGDK
jgi:hypothetical protein